MVGRERAAAFSDFRRILDGVKKDKGMCVIEVLLYCFFYYIILHIVNI